jgi:L-serine dehydratase
MKDYRVFDIIGPVMIGPSSSHTAGACRIARTAKNISDPGFNEVEFQLHGSFAETYKGHGTDKALLAGALGFDTDDKRIRNSFEIAEKEGLKYSFVRHDLGKVHPNSVKVIFKYPNGNQSAIIGSSIGGGNIVIVEIDGIPITYTDEFPTLILKYNEQKGIIHYVSGLLSENDYNIETMRTIKRDDNVTLITETTEEVDQKIIDEIVNDDRFTFAKYIIGE